MAMMCDKVWLVFTLFVVTQVHAASVATCPSTEHGNVLMPHQFDCSSFFLCDGGLGSKPSFLLRCPLGLHFNNGSLNGVCTSTAEVNCQPQIEVNMVAQGQRSDTLPPIESPDSYRNFTLHLPNKRNCSQFYRHEGWSEPNLYECPGSLRFDPVLEICDNEDEVDCRGRECQRVPEPQCPPTNESTVHLPHPTECGSYYTCNWGEPILKHCPDDLYFNPELGVCDWPRNVDCNRCPPNTYSELHEDQDFKHHL